MFKAPQLCCLLISLIFSTKIWSSPWIGTIEPQLHQDLQVLVEWGVLDAAVNTYPVPWKGIAQQLEKIQLETLDKVPSISAQRLKHYLRAYKKQTGQSIASLYAATDDSQLTGFNGLQGPKVRFNVTREFYWGRWAGQLSVNQLRAGERHFDQSFIAYQFGDWNLRLGSLNQWWGPGQSSSLILSNNARPIPALSFSRSQATRSENSWLQYLGPWFFTAQIGQLDSERVIPDAKLWMTRFTFSPIKGLELGLSWSAIWGGQGRSNSIGDWFDVITLEEECALEQLSCETTANHIAGLDFKYSAKLFDQPVSLYGQRVGEDMHGYFRVTNNANLLGVSTYLAGSKLYVESSDTKVTCGASSTNCFYEHGNYQSGYRYHNRAIGSTFERDAKMYTLGLNQSRQNGDLVEIALNHLTFDSDKQVSSPLFSYPTETLIRLSGFYQTQYADWLVKIGASVEHSESYENTTQNDTLVFAEVKYQIN